MPLGEPHRFGESGNIEKHVFRAGQGCHEAAIEFVDEAPQRSRQHPVERSEQAVGRRRERLDNADGTAVLANGGAHRIDHADRGIDGSRRELLVSRHVSQRESTIVQCEQHGVGLGVMDFGTRQQGVLKELIVGASNDLERDAVARRRRDECGLDEIECAVTQQAQSNRRERVQGPAFRHCRSNGTPQADELIPVERKGRQFSKRVADAAFGFRKLLAPSCEIRGHRR